MESEWTPQMMGVLDIGAESLPVLWDADFLYGPRTASGEDTYVLCEINVSSVIPFPAQVPAEIARLDIDAAPGVEPGPPCQVSCGEFRQATTMREPWTNGKPVWSTSPTRF